MDGTAKRSGWLMFDSMLWQLGLLGRWQSLQRNREAFQGNRTPTKPRQTDSTAILIERFELLIDQNVIWIDRFKLLIDSKAR
jgi:hypothetical protein